MLKLYVNPFVINGLHTTEEIMGKIQEFFLRHFVNYKVRVIQNQVKDLTTIEQEEYILSEHIRAHRNAVENKKKSYKNTYTSLKC